MPADPRLKALAHEIEVERRHALDLSPAGGGRGGRGVRRARPRSAGEPGGGFAALSSGDAELDEAIMSETALQLFPTDDPKPGAKKATALARPAAAPEDREATSGESAYATRERLRGERSRLVGDVARRTGKSAPRGPGPHQPRHPDALGLQRDHRAARARQRDAAPRALAVIKAGSL